MVWVNAVVQGVLLGGLYALFATGLSLVFGVMRLVNLAHGDLIVLAAFLSVDARGRRSSWSPLTTLVLARPAHGGARVRPPVRVAQLHARQRALSRCSPRSASSVIIQNALLERYSADLTGLDAGAIETESIHVSDDISIGWFPLLTFAVARRPPRRSPAR